MFFNNTLDLLGKKNIEHVRNLMNELPCSMQRAMDILKLTAYERKEIKQGSLAHSFLERYLKKESVK